MKTIKLTQDNHDKITVTTTVSEIETTCKRVLGWKTPTKHYTSIHNRFMNSGSIDYDKVIQAIHEKQFMKFEQNPQFRIIVN